MAETSPRRLGSRQPARTANNYNDGKANKHIGIVTKKAVVSFKGIAKDSDTQICQNHTFFVSTVNKNSELPPHGQNGIVKLTGLPLIYKHAS